MFLIPEGRVVQQHPDLILIDRTITGDVDAFAELQQHPDTVTNWPREHVPTEVVSVDAVLAVLDAWESGRVSPERVQAWASFVRRGFLPRPDPSPISPIPIDYDLRDEDRIVEAIARLDEIGDLIDGDASPEEVRSLLLNDS